MATETTVPKATLAERLKYLLSDEGYAELQKNAATPVPEAPQELTVDNIIRALVEEAAKYKAALDKLTQETEANRTQESKFQIRHVDLRKLEEEIKDILCQAAYHFIDGNKREMINHYKHAYYLAQGRYFEPLVAFYSDLHDRLKDSLPEPTYHYQQQNLRYNESGWDYGFPRN